jgi:serine/threonine protein kinase
VNEDTWIGRTIAERYRIVAPLGHGGFGGVCRATHIETGGDVAVKMIHAHHASDPKIVERFNLEARNTHGLHHPNTVRLTAFGRAEGGELYLVSEYINGRTLADVVAHEAPVGTDRAVHIVMQILRSLGEAHGAGLVHRGIKPQNVMLVDQFGVPDFVKVLDFGIARSLTEVNHSSGLVGTPSYMAPEQWYGRRLDARADIYAVGCVLYQLLTAQRPFDQPGAADDVDAHHLNGGRVATPARRSCGNRRGADRDADAATLANPGAAGAGGAWSG